MREIKFRAWDRKSSQMVYPSVVGNPFDSEELELMQFTGLKDVQGREVYEGDIIKPEKLPSDDPYEEVGEIYWDGDGYYWAIKWRNVDRGFVKSNLDKLMAVFASGLEIIGNIYENPELLKEKK